MVSISPVPKLDPGPVSYFQFAQFTGEPAAPAKLSLNTVVQPAGAPGTVVAEAGWVRTAAASVSADNGVMTAAALVIRRSLRPGETSLRPMVSNIDVASC